jgi:hypothetical protein
MTMPKSCTVDTTVFLPPHPEERGTRVSKDQATARAAWFETALSRLLNMRGVSLKTPEIRPFTALSDDRLDGKLARE